jgi:NADH-quinone oxidoreductase subunit J
VAGLYVLMQADFIAIVQLIVYVGGILILLLFGVMLTNKITDTDIKTGVWQVLPGSIIVGMFAGILIAAMTRNPWKIHAGSTIPLNALGGVLINEYALVFELLGVLLLIALIGAASIARKQ